jgi:hypothetical protein
MCMTLGPPAWTAGAILLTYGHTLIINVILTHLSRTWRYIIGKSKTVMRLRTRLNRLYHVLRPRRTAQHFACLSQRL